MGHIVTARYYVRVTAPGTPAREHPTHSIPEAASYAETVRLLPRTAAVIMDNHTGRAVTRGQVKAAREAQARRGDVDLGRFAARGGW